MMANAAYRAINDALPRESDQCVFFEPVPSIGTLRAGVANLAGDSSWGVENCCRPA